MTTAESLDSATERAMLARFATPGRPADRPLATFLAGQMGSGKTSAAESVRARLPEGEAHVTIDGDAIAQMHPRYAAIEVALGTAEAQRRTLAFASRWQSNLMRHAEETGAHITIEVAPARTDVRALAFERELSGYETKLSILAVPEHESRQAIFRRRLNEAAERGAGREVSLADHDATYAEWSGALARIHAAASVGAIEVLSNRRAAKSQPAVIGEWRRDTAGTYSGPAESPLTLLTQERSRPIGAAERFAHSRRWTEIARAGVAEAGDLRAADEARLKADPSQRLRRELRLAGNADAKLNGSAEPSSELSASLTVTRSTLESAARAAHVTAAAAQRPSIGR